MQHIFARALTTAESFVRPASVPTVKLVQTSHVRRDKESTNETAETETEAVVSFARYCAVVRHVSNQSDADDDDGDGRTMELVMNMVDSYVEAQRTCFGSRGSFVAFVGLALAMEIGRCLRQPGQEWSAYDSDHCAGGDMDALRSSVCAALVETAYEELTHRSALCADDLLSRFSSCPLRPMDVMEEQRLALNVDLSNYSTMAQFDETLSLLLCSCFLQHFTGGPVLTTGWQSLAPTPSWLAAKAASSAAVKILRSHLPRPFAPFATARTETARENASATSRAEEKNLEDYRTILIQRLIVTESLGKTAAADLIRVDRGVGMWCTMDRRPTGVAQCTIPQFFFSGTMMSAVGDEHPQRRQWLGSQRCSLLVMHEWGDEAEAGSLEAEVGQGESDCLRVVIVEGYVAAKHLRYCEMMGVAVIGGVHANALWRLCDALNVVPGLPPTASALHSRACSVQTVSDDDSSSDDNSANDDEEERKLQHSLQAQWIVDCGTISVTEDCGYPALEPGYLPGVSHYYVVIDVSAPPREGVNCVTDEQPEHDDQQDAFSVFLCAASPALGQLLTELFWKALHELITCVVCCDKGSDDSCASTNVSPLRNNNNLGLVPGGLWLEMALIRRLDVVSTFLDQQEEDPSTAKLATDREQESRLTSWIGKTMAVKCLRSALWRYCHTMIMPQQNNCSGNNGFGFAYDEKKLQELQECLHEFQEISSAQDATHSSIKTHNDDWPMMLVPTPPLHNFDVQRNFTPGILLGDVAHWVSHEERLVSVLQGVRLATTLVQTRLVYTLITDGRAELRVL